MASRRDFREWLAEQVPISARRQLTNLATMLAPLLVGPLGSLLQSVFTGDCGPIEDTCSRTDSEGTRIAPQPASCTTPVLPVRWGSLKARYED